MFSLMQNQLSVNMIKGTLAFAHSSSSSSLDEKSKKKKLLYSPVDGSYKELLFCFKFTTFRNQTKWPRSRTSSVSRWLHVKALLTTNRLYTEGKAVSWARSQWNAHEPDVIWFLDEQPDIISPGSRATAAGTRGLGSPHVSAPLVERKQQTALVKTGPPDGICASVPTLDPLTADQYLISLVSFVFVLNNPHSQKKKTSDALADLHLSEVAVELLLQLMRTVDKFMKKRARSHPIH